MFQPANYFKPFLTIILVLTVTSVATAAPQTFTGVLTETMCKAKHMLPGKTDAECTRTCVKANSKYALVQDKNVYVLVGSQEEAYSLAGKRVRVTGEKSGETITVKSISSAGN